MAITLVTRWRTAPFLPALLVLTVLGCDDHSPVRPLPAPEGGPPPLAEGSISGTVYAHGTTASHPQSGVRLRLRAFMHGPRETISDSTGRYEFLDVPVNTTVIIAPPFDSDYLAPCPSGSYVTTRDAIRLDVHVVATTVLATSGPASFPAVRPFVQGTVSGPSGPVAGASVEMGNPGDAASSATLTAQNGAFLLCTVPPGAGTDQDVELRVRKDGYHPLAYVVNLGGGDVGHLRLDLVPR